jgi:hypothetical protein
MLAGCLAFRDLPKRNIMRFNQILYSKESPAQREEAGAASQRMQAVLPAGLSLLLELERRTSVPDTISPKIPVGQFALTATSRPEPLPGASSNETARQSDGIIAANIPPEERAAMEQNVQADFPPQALSTDNYPERADELRTRIEELTT